MTAGDMWTCWIAGGRRRRRPPLQWLLPIDRKREQNIPRDRAESRVAGIHNQHSVHDHRTGTIQRSDGGPDSVYGLILTHGIEIPDALSFLGGIGAPMAIER